MIKKEYSKYYNKYFAYKTHMTLDENRLEKTVKKIGRNNDIHTPVTIKKAEQAIR